jgi:hypothetical protein
MKEFKSLFKKISIYLIGTYIGIFIVWLGFVIVESKFGFGFLPSEIAKVLGYIIIVMFWVLMAPSKLLLDSSHFKWLSFPATIDKSYVSMYLVSNLVNIVLMVFVSFIFTLLKHTENFIIKKYGPSRRLL